MWNPEAFGDIYSVTFQKNTISYTDVKNPNACKVNKCLCCSCGDIIKMEIQIHWFTFPVGEQAR